MPRADDCTDNVKSKQNKREFRKLSLGKRSQWEKMMKLYGLKNCDTCRKALKLLPDAILVDVRAQGVPVEIMEQAYAEFGSTLLNTRSTTWRQLNAEEREKPALTLLAEHPALMKRPLIERDGELFLSWSKEVQAALA